MNAFLTPSFREAHATQGGSPYVLLSSEEQRSLFHEFDSSVQALSSHRGHVSQDGRTDDDVSALTLDIRYLVSLLSWVQIPNDVLRHYPQWFLLSRQLICAHLVNFGDTQDRAISLPVSLSLSLLIKALDAQLNAICASVCAEFKLPVQEPYLLYVNKILTGEVTV
ncbi:hypothetical protein M413DRAFT_28055 [Hebeloma cylindrosporum]|uniref:Uncharacterized protein n=1 Tax=Hebeloma cylindrosporum TaxID=76867 RepID=A0A0C2XTD2_HEBCY|nr:hypothetical protein M413DRAFT_28055 [Hebeloma cylindrosporum h7]